MIKQEQFMSMMICESNFDVGTAALFHIVRNPSSEKDTDQPKQKEKKKNWAFVSK